LRKATTLENFITGHIGAHVVYLLKQANRELAAGRWPVRSISYLNKRPNGARTSREIDFIVVSGS
jgi:hypothetical protein